MSKTQNERSQGKKISLKVVDGVEYMVIFRWKFIPRKYKKIEEIRQRPREMERERESGTMKQNTEVYSMAVC